MSETITPKKSAELLPLYDNLIMEECAPISKIGHIIVPEAHQKILNQGRVVDRGPLVTEAIQLGDIVFFTQHSESRLAFRGKKFIIAAESACLGIIRGANVDETIPEEETILKLSRQISTP